MAEKVKRYEDEIHEGEEISTAPFKKFLLSHQSVTKYAEKNPTCVHSVQCSFVPE